MYKSDGECKPQTLYPEIQLQEIYYQQHKQYIFRLAKRQMLYFEMILSKAYG